MKNLAFFLLSSILMTSLAFTQSNFQSEGAIKSKEIKALLNNQINNQSENFNFLQNEIIEPLKSIKFDYGDPPVWNWVNQFGGSGKDLASDIVTDEAGNIYITGHFSGEISIGSNTYSSIGNWDGFVAKLTPEGGLSWFEQLSPGPDREIKIYGICLDDNDNVYVTGYYTGTIVLGGTVLGDQIPMNLFFAKLDTSGGITLAANHGITFNMEVGKAIDVDAEGNIFIVGSKDGNMGVYDRSVILKFNSEGLLFIEIEHDQNFVDLSVFDESIYFTGSINGEGYIGDFYFDPVSYGDMFLAKSDLWIEFEWAHMAEHENNGDSRSTGLYVAEDGNIYITGGYRSDIILGGNQISNLNSGFIAKCTPEGDFIWVNQLTTEPHTQFYPLSISGNNNEIFASYRYANSSTTYYPELSSYSTSNGDVINVKSLENNVEDVHYSAASEDIICSIDNDENITISNYTTALTENWNMDFEGNSAKAWILGMNADDVGNFYIYGYASNTIDLFGTQIEKGLFLAKVNSYGYLFWLKYFPDSFESKKSGNYMVVDDNSNSIYITGTFYDSFQIPGEITLEPHPDGSIIVIKYDLDGNFQWAMQEDFEGDNLCLSPDYSGNILISGVFDGTISIGNTTLTSVGELDAFVSKYNQDGEFQWAFKAGGEVTEYNGIVSTDAQNNIYFTGEFTSENVIFNGWSITFNEGEGNIIFAKIDENGTTLWITKEGASLIPYGDYYCWPTSLKTDAVGNSYVKGWHADSTYFQNAFLTSLFNTPNYNNKWNEFIIKINPDGITSWAKTISAKHWGYDYNQLDIDEDGNVYFGAQIKDTLIFGNDFTYIKSGEYDLFVAKYNNYGVLDWVKIMESGTRSCFLSSVAVYDNYTVFAAGSFYGQLDFGNSQLTTNNENAFVTLFGETTGIKIYEREDTSQLFNLYPNPAQDKTNLSFKNTDLSETNIIISDIAGKIVFEKNIQINQQNLKIDISEFSKGVYLVKVQAGELSEVKKLIID